MATTATDTERQYDEFGEPIPTEEELAKQRADQEAERLKTEQALKLAGGMTGLEGQLPNTLPTQVAPVPAVPQPAAMGGAAYQEGRGIGVLAAPPRATNQGRMYMGPAMAPQQEQQFMQSAPGTRMNLMPPPPVMSPDQQAAMQGSMAAGTGGESNASALARLQAADVPGSRTIGVQSEPPYSDASVANQRNATIYEALRKIQAGDKSPETAAIAMGGIGRGMTPYQQAQVQRWNTPASLTPFQAKQIERWGSQDSQNKKLDEETRLKAKDLYSQKAMLQGQIASPNTAPKKVAALQSQLDVVNAGLKEIFPPKAGTTAPSAAAPATPIQPPTKSNGTLTRDKAKDFLSQANGDKAKARQLARDAGYEL